MMVGIMYQNATIVTAVQYSGDTINTVGRYMDMAKVSIEPCPTPQTVMAIWLVLREQRHKFNSGGYGKLLETVVKSWLVRIAPGQLHLWQQDPIPCQIWEGVAVDLLASFLLSKFPWLYDCNPINVQGFDKKDKPMSKRSRSKRCSEGMRQVVIKAHYWRDMIWHSSAIWIDVKSLPYC